MADLAAQLAHSDENERHRAMISARACGRDLISANPVHREVGMHYPPQVPTGGKSGGHPGPNVLKEYGADSGRWAAEGVFWLSGGLNELYLRLARRLLD